MKTHQLVQTLKDNGEDFEFYPSTPEIIAACLSNIPEHCSVLDIGAGRGDVLEGLRPKAEKLFAIEKSQTLLAELANDIFVVGTDFHRQTLIDKQVDVIFCNPPFSEFVEWAAKIIREANAKTVLLVMPERWKDASHIQEALKVRNATAKVINHMSFAKADRPARGIVNLVKVTIGTWKDSRNKTHLQDPFAVWFAETFKDEIASSQQADDLRSKERGLIAKNRELVEGRNLIETLEALYLTELESYITAYKKVISISPALLEEVGVTYSKVVGSLEEKIKGLKNRYWKELFDNFDMITRRLTSKSRGELLGTLTSNTHIDFTADNAYAVVLWAIKNANSYIDRQLVNLYRRLSDPACAIAYKSNRHFKECSFRFNSYGDHERDASHYKLDYRIVNHGYCFDAFDIKWHKGCPLSLRDDARDIINDMLTVAHTLGFSIASFQYLAYRTDWMPGSSREFDCHNSHTKKTEQLASVRAFQNGNLHIKLNRDFLLRLNVEAARILGWIHNVQEAAEEMGESVVAVQKAYGSNYRITLDSTHLLGEPTAQAEEEFELVG